MQATSASRLFIACKKNQRVALIFSEYNQQDAAFINLFIPIRRSNIIQKDFRPSSVA